MTQHCMECGRPYLIEESTAEAPRDCCCRGCEIQSTAALDTWYRKDPMHTYEHYCEYCRDPYLIEDSTAHDFRHFCEMACELHYDADAHHEQTQNRMVMREAPQWAWEAIDDVLIRTHSPVVAEAHRAVHVVQKEREA